MSLESGRVRRRLLRDPLAIRAMAHPIRIRVYGLVGRAGPVTAAEVARRLGISQALASHHLRQLAKYGFVEPAPGRDNRERPWRTTATSLDWGGEEDGAAERSAGDLLDRILLETALGNLMDWQERSADWDPKWRRVTGGTQHFVHLTYEELERVQRDIRAVIQPYIDARPLGEPGSAPEGSAPVEIATITSIVPLPEAPGDEGRDEGGRG
jgi:DNA-binding transcriptional ArsR family regulator